MRKEIRRGLLVVVGAVASSNSAARACEYHALLGLQEPTGIWLTSPLSSLAPSLSTQLGVKTRIVPADAPPVTNPAIIDWKLNTTAAKAHSTDSTINGWVS